jgi:hypothetical protein
MKWIPTRHVLIIATSNITSCVDIYLRPNANVNFHACRAWHFLTLTFIKIRWLLLLKARHTLVYNFSICLLQGTRKSRFLSGQKVSIAFRFIELCSGENKAIRKLLVTIYAIPREVNTAGSAGF